MKLFPLLLFSVLLLGCADYPRVVFTVSSGSTTVPITYTQTKWYAAAFTDAALTGSQVTITHSLADENVIVQVWDDENYNVLPTSISVIDGNNVTLDFAGMNPLTGWWTVVVLAPGSVSTKSYFKQFTNSDLSSNTLTVVHGLASQYVLTQVFDSSGRAILPTNINYAGVNSLTVDLTGHTPISGNWKLIVRDVNVTGGTGAISAFTNSDLTSNEYVWNHNINKDDFLTQVVDENNDYILVSNIFDKNNMAELLYVNGLIPLSGTWRGVTDAKP
jgi:hypothetical protein